MRLLVATAAALLCLGSALPATAAITCADIPAAQKFVDGLKPGPNTRQAQAHLDKAKSASSDSQCVAELGQVNKYAAASAAADKKAASRGSKTASRRSRPRHVACADSLHQNRPGGTDYHGPPVAGCPQRKI
jgi:hypothetical protein